MDQFIVTSRFSKKNQNSLDYVGTFKVIEILQEFETKRELPNYLPENLFNYKIWKDYENSCLEIYSIFVSCAVPYYMANENDNTYTMQIWMNADSRQGIHNKYQNVITTYEIKRDKWLNLVGIDLEWYSGEYSISEDKLNYSYTELQTIFENIKLISNR